MFHRKKQISSRLLRLVLIKLIKIFEPAENNKALKHFEFFFYGEEQKECGDGGGEYFGYWECPPNEA